MIRHSTFETSWAAAVLGVLALLSGAPVACAQSPAAGSAQAQRSPASTAVAEVDGEPITADEVEKALGANLDRLEQQIYQLKLQQIDRLVADRLLAREAAKRGSTVDALLAAEVAARIPPVTDEDVDRFYETNKARLPQQADIKTQIRRFLEEQRRKARHDEFVGSLREAAKVVVSLAPPPVTRATVAIDGAPSKGPSDAPVTIVEFSDFHCPFCRRVKPTVAQLLAKYPDKIKLVYRDLPLDSLHPAARAAAEAARCAHDQGRFWPYHDKLYERAPDASPATLRAIAGEVGLDGAAFDRCVAGGTHRDAVQASVEEAERLGANATPAFFINGRLLSGAQPLEAFVRIVEEELSGNARTR